MTEIQMPDGQSFEMEDNIAGTDDLLRDALRVAYPDAATAEFRRSTKGERKIVKVVKKAGTKGASFEKSPVLIKAITITGDTTADVLRYAADYVEDQTERIRDIIVTWNLDQEPMVVIYQEATNAVRT